MQFIRVAVQFIESTVQFIESTPCGLLRVAVAVYY